MYTIASFACLRIQSVDAFIGLRFVQGIGGSAGMVLARAMVHDRGTSRQRARTFSLLMLVSSAVPLFAPLMGTALLAMGGWRAIFGMMGALGLVLLAISHAIPETLAINRGGLIDHRRTLRTW